MKDYFQPVADCNVINDCKDCPFIRHGNRLTYLSSCSIEYATSKLYYRGSVEFFIDNAGTKNDAVGGAEQVRFLDRTFNIVAPIRDVSTNFRFKFPYLQEIEGNPTYRMQGREVVIIRVTKSGNLILEN